MGGGVGIWPFPHIDDAVRATVAAIERGGRGIINIVEQLEGKFSRRPGELIHAKVCGGAGPWRQRLFAWALARLGNRLDRYLGQYKKRLFAGISGTVLEIGPGAGTNLRYLGSATRWIGIEPNPFLHERLLQEARRTGVRAEVRSGAAEILPVPDGSVDAVISTLVLCSVVDPRRVLEEVLRVLKPGGKLVLIEHAAAPRGTWLRRVQHWLLPLWRQMGDGCHPDRETWRDLESAPFEELALERFMAPVPIVSPHIAGVAVKAL